MSRTEQTEPAIVGYYFRRDAFIKLGSEMGTPVIIENVHSKSPYSEFRFNAIYQKPLV